MSDRLYLRLAVGIRLAIAAAILSIGTGAALRAELDPAVYKITIIEDEEQNLSD